MKLFFKTRFDNGSPTYFVDKISESWEWDFNNSKSLWHRFVTECHYSDEVNVHFSNTQPHEKIHTLRGDRRNRYRIGMKIHFYTMSKKRAVCFGTGEVKAIQYAVINVKLQRIYILDQKDGMGHARELLGVDLATFVLNDGFDSLEQFWGYFQESKTYKIIHWTNFKY